MKKTFFLFLTFACGLNTFQMCAEETVPSDLLALLTNNGKNPPFCFEVSLKANFLDIRNLSAEEKEKVKGILQKGCEAAVAVMSEEDKQFIVGIIQPRYVTQKVKAELDKHGLHFNESYSSN